jgi:hypothetical protein
MGDKNMKKKSTATKKDKNKEAAKATVELTNNKPKKK